MLDDAGTAMQQQLVALAGCGAMKVEIAGTGLTEQVLGNKAAQYHGLCFFKEQLRQLLATGPENSARNHRLYRGL